MFKLLKLLNELTEKKIIDLRSDTIQKIAWRLVRSAEDRMKSEEGNEKRLWCVSRLLEICPEINERTADEFVRSAYFNFKIEASNLPERRSVV